MDRKQILEAAKDLALFWIEDDTDLPLAVSEFVALCNEQKLDPPIHHAEITLATLLAEQGDVKGLKAWLEKQS